MNTFFAIKNETKHGSFYATVQNGHLNGLGKVPTLLESEAVANQIIRSYVNSCRSIKRPAASLKVVPVTI